MTRRVEDPEGQNQPKVRNHLLSNEISEMKGKESRFYDSATPDRRLLYIEKVVEITDRLPRSQRNTPTMLFYINSQRGMVVDIDRKVTAVAYHLTDDSLIENIGFRVTAELMGLRPERLLAILRANVPTETVLKK